MRDENRVGLMEWEGKFLRDIDGVGGMMVYENMGVGVKRFVGGDKKGREGLMKMWGLYCFE